MEAIWENNLFNEEQELADDAYSKHCAWMDTLYLVSPSMLVLFDTANQIVSVQTI
jgi:hypothetical protein